MVIACRGIVGLMNGNVGILRTIVAEMVQDKELQPKAFSIMPMIWTIGSIFGPSLGGSLAKPAEKYPEIFGGYKFLREYPFFLPNLVTCVFFIVGISTGWLFLHETLAAKQGHRDPGIVLGRLITQPCTGKREKASRKGLDGEAAPLLGDRQPRPKVELKRPGWRDVLGPQSTLILLTYTLMSVHTMAFESLIPVFLHTPPQQIDGNPDVDLPFKFAGGSGMDAQRIGLFYTITGVVGIVVQFYLFPTYARRFGVLNCVKASATIFPIIYFLTPYVSLVPSGLPRNIAIALLIGSKLTASIFNFPGITILLTNSAKSLSVLGTLNGVATSASALGRAAGPALLGPIFSLGVRAGYIIIPWWFLSFLAVIAGIPTLFIVEGEGFARSQPEPVVDEDEDPIKHANESR
ncbi:major facilitator superfamily domain-containing protein [Aspergillus stella-maris]|uniref:major facilitator superfamily domain-containing protein n=1 Tax=Aspergillus stella-maris TaxID=1810926 RepID=UPI003CCE4057